MSLDITKKISLNTNNTKPTDTAKVKKGSLGTFTVVVTINDKGGVLELPPGTTAKVRMLKPGGGQVLNDCEVVGNEVRVLVSESMQAVPGDGQCEVILFYAGKTLTSATFPLPIEGNVHDDSQIESAPEYTTLLNSLIRIEGAIPKAEEAYTIALEAQQVVDDIQADFAQMQTDNATAVSNADTATSNAEEATSVTNQARIDILSAEATRVSNENTRKSNEISRLSEEGDRTTAELARASSEADRLSNEVLRQSQEGTRQTQETGRQEYHNAYKVCEVYNNTKAYTMGNKVTYQGSTYQNILACNGILPSDTTRWIVIAQKGIDGAGAGDMLANIYDPTGRHTDIFAHDTMDDTVTFNEAVADVDIASADTHATIFGKILKSIKTLRTVLADKFDKVNIGQTDTINDATKVASTAITHAHGLEIDALYDNLAGFITRDLGTITGGTIDDAIHNIFNTLPDRKSAIVNFIYSSACTAIFQRYISGYGSVILFGYGFETPSFYAVANGVWANKSFTMT